MNTIGKMISEGRKNKGLSQSQLADKMAISPQAVSKWERDETLPDIITLNKLARIFEVDLNYFSFDNSGENYHSTASEQDGANQDNTAKPSRQWNMGTTEWKNADFSGIAGIADKFKSANVNNCKFKNSNLSDILFKRNNIKKCDFSASNLSGSQFSMCCLPHNIFKDCNFKNATIKMCDVYASDFTNADFTDAALSGTAFKNNILQNAVFYKTEFKNMSFVDTVINSNITDCSFTGCSFRKTEFRNLTFTNTFFKNQNMKHVAFVNCKADRITYSFLAGNKANVSGICLTED